MMITEHGVSLKSGFKKIALTQTKVLILNMDSQKYCLHQIFLNSEYTEFAESREFIEHTEFAE